MQLPTYDVRCPHCSRQASAVMRQDGTRGTYREVFLNYVAQRITCSSCGYHQSSEEPLPYELWYRVNVGRHVAWAVNRSQAVWLISYLLHRIPAREIDRSVIETLPAWMTTPKHRILVAHKLEQLLLTD